MTKKNLFFKDINTFDKYEHVLQQNHETIKTVFNL